MPDTESMQFITINDWRPGIYSDYHAGSGQPVDTTKGAFDLNAQQMLRNIDNTSGYRPLPSFPAKATIQNTYRCCAEPATGSLVPLPVVTAGKTQTLLPGGNTNVGSTFYPGTRQAAYLMDAVVRGPMYQTTTIEGFTNADSTEVFTLYQFFYDPAGTSTYSWFVQGVLYEQWRNAPAVRHYAWSKGAISGTVYQLGSGSLDRNRTVDTVTPGASLGIGNYIPIVWAAYGIQNRGSSFSTGATPANERSLHTYDTDMSVIGLSYVVRDIGSGTVFCFPNPGALVAMDLNTKATGLFPNPAMAVSHQGRCVVISKVGAMGNWDSAGGVPVYQVKDTILYLPIIDFQANAAGTTWSARKPTFLEVGEENVNAIELAASLSADELLIIKSRDGGYIIRGDLDDPTVQRLPFIESTQGAMCRPTVTPLGLVYGTVNGIFVYQGGDTAQKISPQLDGYFWNHASSGEVYQGYRGRMGYLHPFVAVPNNYLFDVRTDAWWRLELPDATAGPLPFSVYEPHPTTNKLRCFPYKLTPTRNEVWYDMDPTVLASSYSWQSHPLAQTQDRLTTVHQIVLEASVASALAATNTVTVTLTGYSPTGVAATPVATVFNLANSSVNPQIIKKDVALNFNALHIQIQIQVTANTGPAAKIHSLNVGVTQDRARVPKS